MLEHALSRIIQIGVIETASIGLLGRSPIDGKDTSTPVVEQMRLNAPAEIRTDLEIVVRRTEIADGKLDREE